MKHKVLTGLGSQAIKALKESDVKTVMHVIAGHLTFPDPHQSQYCHNSNIPPFG
jgi:hypothetical protein